MSKKFIFPFIFLLASLLVLFHSQPVLAQEPKPTPSDNEVNRVAKKMYCPVCENIPLDVCPTKACSEWRELIRLKLSEGWTDEQIKEYFAAQYGDRVLDEPPRRGLNWLVYVIPVLFFFSGAVVLGRVLQHAQKKPSHDVVKTLSVSDPYLKEIEEKLKSQE